MAGKKVRKDDVPIAARPKMPSKYGYRQGPKRPRGLGDGHPCKIGISQQLNPGAEYTDEEREFMMAMDRYKRRNNRPFPTWHEVLQVVIALGYRKVADATELPTHPSMQ